MAEPSYIKSETTHLPGISPGGETTKPIQSSLSQADIAGPYSLLAHGLSKVGATADEIAS